MWLYIEISSQMRKVRKFTVYWWPGTAPRTVTVPLRGLADHWRRGTSRPVVRSKTCHQRFGSSRKFTTNCSRKNPFSSSTVTVARPATTGKLIRKFCCSLSGCCFAQALTERTRQMVE